jgi:hypothetical protein
MLMQMLAAGGMPVLTVAVRAADEDNPRGYFELEPLKRIFRDTSWAAEAGGEAVKIVAPLLHALPAGTQRRIVFIEREIDEVLASQAAISPVAAQKMQQP